MTNILLSPFWQETLGFAIPAALFCVAVLIGYLLGKKYKKK